MNRQLRKVVHVELLDPPAGYDKHYYFGSIAAIYETIPREVLRIAPKTLWNNLVEGSKYVGGNAIVRQGRLLRKKTNRGIRKEE